MNHVQKYLKHLAEQAIDSKLLTKVKAHGEAYSKALYQQRYSFTEFLNPQLIDLINPLQDHQVQFVCYGGHPDAEYQMGCFTPAGLTVSKDDYPIELLSFNYPVKFGEIRHKDLLGTLLSAGFDRSQFGDFSLHKGYCQLIVAAEIAPDITREIDTINRLGIRWQNAAHSEFIPHQSDVDSCHFSAASTRLDVMLAAAFQLSRTKANQAIKNHLVKCNYKVITKPDLMLTMGDMISLRGAGRFYYDALKGHSKKGKLRIEGRRIKR